MIINKLYFIPGFKDGLGWCFAFFLMTNCSIMFQIMGYLSGSSPHIKSGAVSVLSVLVYKDADICTSAPELVPSVLALLQGKAVEVVKVSP